MRLKDSLLQRFVAEGICLQLVVQSRLFTGPEFVLLERGDQGRAGGDRQKSQQSQQEEKEPEMFLKNYFCHFSSQ